MTMMMGRKKLVLGEKAASEPALEVTKRGYRNRLRSNDEAYNNGGKLGRPLQLGGPLGFVKGAGPIGQAARGQFGTG